MNYIKLKGEILLLDNILHAEIKENTIEILYGINVPEQGNKFYGHILDYSEVKNDVNEEKTKIEQDYEKLMFMLKVNDFNIHSEKDFQELKVENNKLLSHKMILQDNIERQTFLLSEIKTILYERGINKIGKIKKIFKKNGF